MLTDAGRPIGLAATARMRQCEGHRNAGSATFTACAGHRQVRLLTVTSVPKSASGMTYVCPAASAIKFVIVSGCDMRETWLAFTSIVVALMRFAMKRSRSGLIVRSSAETAYQLGFDRHAAWVVMSASNVRLNGT